MIKGKDNKKEKVKKNKGQKAFFTVKKKKEFISALGFLIIPLIIFTLFVVIPVIQGAYFSLYKWTGLGKLTKFIGFKNFATVFTDPIFHKALINNFIIILVSLFIELPLALIIALTIGRKFKGSVAFRTIFFLPFILAEIIAGVIWVFIFNPQFGIQNTFITEMFPWFGTFSFLGDINLVFYSICGVIIWKYFGLHMIIYIAGLQGIPEELEEASQIDGVNRWQLNWHIILPLLWPTILISVFFSTIGSLQIFDLIWAMSTGGPVHASETMVTYLYNYGFIRFNIGYGSATAVVIFLICLIFSLLYQKFILSKEK